MTVARRTVVTLAAAGSALAVAGCAKQGPATVDQPTGTTTGAPGSPSPASTPTPTPTPEPQVTMTPSVAEGAQVPVDTLVKVTATLGTLASVAMTYTDPKAGKQTVQGTLSPDATTWTAGALLEPGMTYELAMKGLSTKGTEATKTSTFRSQALSLKQQIFPTIASGGTVGVAMPVVVLFDVPVADKATFQKKMTVTATPATEGSWRWLSSTEAHWRPKELWAPGTKVAINVDINSIPAGNGTYGQKSVTGSMTIGRSVILKADLASHQMQVVVDGALARTVPITGGKAGFETRSGKKVLMEKFEKLKMDANTVGIEPGDPEYYNIPDVQYAMRETNSGEFIHAAPWSTGSQGKANVSHGCIGVSTDAGAWLFQNCRVGDLIEVTGTKRGLEQGNGWTDWNISFDEYKKGSAL